MAVLDHWSVNAFLDLLIVAALFWAWKKESKQEDEGHDDGGEWRN